MAPLDALAIGADNVSPFVPFLDIGDNGANGHNSL